MQDQRLTSCSAQQLDAIELLLLTCATEWQEDAPAGMATHLGRIGIEWRVIVGLSEQRLD